MFFCCCWVLGGLSKISSYVEEGKRGGGAASKKSIKTSISFN